MKSMVAGLVVAGVLAMPAKVEGPWAAHVVAYIEWAFDSCGDALPMDWMVVAGALRAQLQPGEVLAARLEVAELARRDGVRAVCGSILSVLAEARAKGAK